VRVLVAGAGVIGCAIADELSRRGAAVTIADPRPVGGGATQASAGMLVPYHEAEHAGPFLTLAERSLALYDGFIERLRDDVPDADVDYARTGTLEVALDDEGAAALDRQASALRVAGVECRRLDAVAARAMEPQLASGITGALLIAAHGFVAQEAMTAALARAAAARGASVINQSVCAVRRSGTTLIADTDKGSIEADRVVVAAGSWSGQLRVGSDPPVRPIRGQLLRLDWPRAPLARIVWGPRCYLVPRRDGTLLVGATVEDVGFDERATVAAVRDLMDAVCEVLPDGWRAGFKEARVGLRPAAPDGLPILGRSISLDDVVYATGHYRNGVLLAPITAKLVADLVLDGREDPLLEAFSPRRFSEDLCRNFHPPKPRPG
jgi:glycine oxidase